VSYCINPRCSSRQNDDAAEYCASCQQPLLVNDRFKVVRPLVPSSDRRKSEILEAIDITGSFISPPNSRKVLKVLVQDDDPKVVQLFRREAESLRYFDHPGMPKSDMDDLFTVQIVTRDVFHCFAMSKIEGQNLEEWIQLNGSISQAQAIDWLHQLVEIIHEVHAKGFFHRDIKPSNIIVRPDQKLALIDFGAVRNYGDTYLAKLVFERLTQVYSLGYSPPEQMNGMALPQSDFYALGRTLIYCVTGKNFLDIPIDPKRGEILWQAEAKQIGPALLSMIENLTQPLPKDRPKNTQEIIDYLNDLPRFYKKKIFAQRRKKLLKVAGITAGVAIALGAIQFGRLFQANQLFLVATAQANAGEWNQAKETLEQSLGLNPTADGYEKLGEICYSMSDLDCARTQFEKTIAIAPQKYYPYLRLGRVYEDIADYQNAKDTYLLGTRATDHPAIKNSLARLLIIRKEYDKAEKLLRDAVKVKNINKFFRAGMFKNIAWIYYEKGKYDKTVYYTSESIKIDKEFVIPYCLQAVAKSRLNLISKTDWESCLTKPTTDSSEFEEVIIWREMYIRNSAVDKHE
jgi:serine/threonine protein kinase